MSKIGRKSIDIENVAVEIKGQDVHYKGPNASGVHTLPDMLKAELNDKKLVLVPAKKTRDLNSMWGLHRALLANKIKGASQGFTKEIQIIGLGFKAALTGNKVVFNLGYSHKIDFDLPKDVTLDIDKSGQKLSFKSPNKELVGFVCSQVKALRRTEPYKGTGIKLATETILRKAGKTKS
jgi:large subunit ribosomal protein L6